MWNNVSNINGTDYSDKPIIGKKNKKKDVRH